MDCCQGRVMVGPSGLKRRHKCRAKFGERYDNPRGTAQLERVHRSETARAGLTLERVHVSSSEYAHWSRCTIVDCERCAYIDAHLDDQVDDR